MQSMMILPLRSPSPFTAPSATAGGKSPRRRIGGIACTDHDVMTSARKGAGERTADIAGSDDGELHGDLLSTPE